MVKVSGDFGAQNHRWGIRCRDAEFLVGRPEFFPVIEGVVVSGTDDVETLFPRQAQQL